MERNEVIKMFKVGDLVYVSNPDTILRIYEQERKNTFTTIRILLRSLGRNITLEVLATAAENKYSGEDICPANKQFLRNVYVNPENVCRCKNNRMMAADINIIPIALFNDLVSQLRATVQDDIFY